MADRTFHLGINMAGAVSAGAYTAGVLDFLTQALEEWQAAKDAFRAWLAHPAGPMPTPVPLHDVCIDVFSGASAGGMCACIASVMVQRPFQHIVTGDEVNTTNTFYESWVNRIDIRPLLGDDDLKSGPPLRSLLDCTIIDNIADFALQPGVRMPRPYIANDLTLFVTLTNVTGVPYRLYDDPAPTINEFMSYYADRLRFECTNPGARPLGPCSNALPSGQADAPGWSLLKDAAKATGAVPIALASRIIPRDASEYATPGWIPLCGSGTPVSPSFPTPMAAPFRTLNVDGGCTNNSPFQFAHDFLTQRNPKAQNCTNPRAPEDANVAVITVAPFPTTDTLQADYKPEEHQGIWSIAGSFLNVTLSQSRFVGESLALLTGGATFSRFVIAPSDPAQQQDNALQCATLGAFGGFFERGFRKHDFLLGRRNCQQFLRRHLLLLQSNPIVAGGVADAGAYASQIKESFKQCAPDDNPDHPKNSDWMPIIPLCGAAAHQVPQPARAQIAASDVHAIAGLIMKRLDAVRGYVAEGTLGTWISRVLGILLNTIILRGRVQKAIDDALTKQLGANVNAGG